MPSPQQPPTPPDSSQAPDWFRDVVWDSLLGGLCPLIPIPFVDDLALVWTRRRLITRVGARHGKVLAPNQVRQIAGGGKPFSCLMLFFKIIIYPFRKMLRKILYFLSIKDAIDTFSLLFHQGYLFHRALTLVDSTPGEADHDPIDRCGQAVLETLEVIDTKPLGRTVTGVFRTSRDLVGGAVRWVSSKVLSRRSFDRLESDGIDSATLEAASPETKELLDRLLGALWGDATYRDRLTDEVQRRLERPRGNSTLESSAVERQG